MSKERFTMLCHYAVRGQLCIYDEEELLMYFMEHPEMMKFLQLERALLGLSQMPYGNDLFNSN